MSARKSGRTGRARHRAVRNARKPRRGPPVTNGELRVWVHILRALLSKEPAPGAYRIHPEDLR